MNAERLMLNAERKTRNAGCARLCVKRFAFSIKRIYPSIKMVLLR